MRIGLLADIHEDAANLGHFHHWLLMTPERQIPWAGETVVRLGNWERCLIVVAPVFDGCCAVFDTERTELWPLRW